MTTTLEVEVVSDAVKHGLCGTSLVDLPPELLTAISLFVGCPTVVWCRLVCRLLRDVIDASIELQYRIELVRDGMVDGGLARVGSTPTRPTITHWHTRLTTSDRLARLRQLRKAWQTLSWTHCVTVPMPGPCCAYELVGGVFCKTQPAVQRGRGEFEWPWLVAGDGHVHEEEQEMSQILGSRTMSATWLPGTHTLGHTVVRDDLGIPTRDFAMDPSQDLLVLLKGGEDDGLPMVIVFPGMLELHVRTMSTNQTHPEAKVPILCVPVVYPVTSVLVQIVDDVVGMMYCVDPARPRITIWNWKTGRLVVDRASGCLPPGTWDFSFIHSRAFFVTTGNGNGSIELFTFTCGPTDVSDANADLPEHSSVVHVATLHFPPIQPFARVLSVSTHTGPFLAACPPDAPFVSSNSDRIHVLTIQYVHLPTLDGPRTRPRIGMVVHQRALEAYLEWGAAWKGVAGPNAGAMEVHWSEWGPTHARMLTHIGMFQWLRYVHGQRFVMLLPSSKSGKSTIQVLDFNVHRVFDNAGTDNEEKYNDNTCSCRVNDGRDGDEDEDADRSLNVTARKRVDYPTRLVIPNVFTNAVESGLPYRETRRDVWGDYSGVMIDDERLVGLRNPAFLTGDMKEIDVFTL